LYGEKGGGGMSVPGEGIRIRDCSRIKAQLGQIRPYFLKSGYAAMGTLLAELKAAKSHFNEMK